MAANTSGFYSATSVNNIMCDGRLSFSSFIMMHADSLSLSLPRTVADAEFTPVPALRRISDSPDSDCMFIQGGGNGF